MTLFHFGNCLALAYVPYFFTYKLSGLPEYGAFWKCVQAGLVYMVTQLFKMMLLATFFPTMETGAGFFSDFLKSTVDIADVLGIYLVLAKIAGKGELRFLIAGVGWATAELLLTRVVPLWVGARGVEFDWKYIQLSLDSNINLVHHIIVATLVWLWTRNDLQKSLTPIIMVLLVVSCYKPLLTDMLTRFAGVGSWTILIFRAVITILTGLATVQLYANSNVTNMNY